MTDYRRRARLVLRAQSGDTEALDALLREVQARLFSCIRGVTQDDTLSGDVLQDVLITICRKLHYLQDPVAFDAWAVRVATRAALRRVTRDRHRDRLVVPEEDLDRIAVDVPERLSDPLMLQRLGNAMGAVSPASRAVLTLHYLEGFTIRECADILGIAVGTAKSRLAYGIRALRSTLEEPV